MRENKFINITFDYIPREISNKVKAITLFLIILGHNHQLMPNDGSSAAFYWLYNFHVSTFFILPFLYKAKSNLDIKTELLNAFARNLIPFFYFYTICYIINCIYMKMDFLFSYYLAGFVHWGVSTKETCGFAFPWFLQAFFILQVIKILSNKYKLIYLSSIFAGMIIILYAKDIPYALFESSISFKMFFLGTMTLICIRYFKSLYIYFMIVIFIISTTWFFITSSNTTPIKWILSMSGFCTILAISTIKYGFLEKLLQYIGKHSLIIYLTHVFIYNALAIVIPSAFAILNLLLTTSISVGIAYILDKTPTIKNILLPRKFPFIR